MTTENKQDMEKPRQHVGFLLKGKPPCASDSRDSVSVYSSNMEPRTIRRTRPKTPVFAVGQLERASLIRPYDQAQILAEGYQSVLPPRLLTPCIENESPRHRPRKLRKIQCQVSLRDLIRDQAENPPETSPPPTSYSDTDTLVGSPPTSPTSKEFAKDKLSLPAPEKTERADSRLSSFNNNIGMKICADLLTNELATVLFRHHPAENQDRASGLQILLMIEAYENVLQHVRKQLCDARVAGKEINDRPVREVEKILDHWLQVLYSVYDRSQNGTLDDVVRQEEWPLQRLQEGEEECDSPFD